MEPETIEELKALGPLTPAEVDEHRDWDFAFNIEKWRLINTIDYLQKLGDDLADEVDRLLAWHPELENVNMLREIRSRWPFGGDRGI